MARRARGGLSPLAALGHAGPDQPRARVGARPGAPARPAGGALLRRAAPHHLVGPRLPPRGRGAPERARRADRRGAGRAAALRRGGPARGAEGGEPDLARQGPLQRAAALAHRPLRRGGLALRARGPARRHQPSRQRARGQQRDPGPPARPARAALLRLPPQPAGRGGGRRGLLLRDADLRHARGQVHLAILAHVRGGGPEGPLDPAPHRRAGRGPRPARPGLRRAGLRDGPRVRRHPAPEQPRDLPRAHRLRGRAHPGPRPPAHAPLAGPVEQPPAARGVREPLGPHRARRGARRHRAARLRAGLPPRRPPHEAAGATRPWAAR